MPTVCVCNCGFEINDDGQLCPEWGVLGVKRVCSTQVAYSNPMVNLADWSLLRDQFETWTNTTCRTARVLASVHMPYVKIKVGRGNAWEVRMMFDGAVNAAIPYTPARDPELQWSHNYYLAHPAGTDSEITAPGHYETEFLVPPGGTVTVVARMQARTVNYAPQAANLLAFGPLTVALTAFPADVASGSGRRCVPA